jgi:hypothetical protein
MKGQNLFKDVPKGIGAGSCTGKNRVIDKLITKDIDIVNNRFIKARGRYCGD